MRVPLLWRLAPGVLFRFPRSAAAVAFSAGVVVLATILGPLFLASSERASLQAEMERNGRWRAGLQIVWQPFRYGVTDEEQERLRRLGDEGARLLTERTAGVPGIAPAVVTFLGGHLRASTEAGTAFVRLVHRTGARDNVTVLDRGGPGVWIADFTADALDVEPGDMISLRAFGRVVRPRVGGIYRFLPEDEPRPYWSLLSDFVDKQPEADTIQPPFVLAGAGFVTRTDLGTQLRWELPLEAADLTPQTLKGAERAFRRVTRETIGRSGPLGETLLELGGGAYDPSVDSLLPGMIETAQDRLDASQAPAGVVTVTARFLGAGLVIAAGLSLVARRRSEVRALIGRGAGPLALALRFLVEGAAPVVAGAFAGIAAGYFGVRALGASGGVEWSYVEPLLDDAVVAAAGALVLLAGATGAAVLREERSFSARSSAPGGFVSIAAGAAVAAGGFLAYRSLDEVTVSRSGEPLSGSILLAPIGLIAAAALAGGVVLRLTLPFVAASARRRSTGIFLAARRLAAGSGMTHALVIVCGSALGVMFFGLTVAGSVHATATAKAKTFVGSDLAVGVAPSAPALPDLPFPATHVTKIETYLEGSTQGVTVLGVEPDTFEEAAFWDDEFASEPLSDLLAGLGDDESGPIPVVAAGFDGAATPVLAGSEVPLEVTGRANAFPGMTPRQPLVAMTVDSARRALASGVGGSRSDFIWGSTCRRATPRRKWPRR
jgi:putative ABC transport system permease protein